MHKRNQNGAGGGTRPEDYQSRMGKEVIGWKLESLEVRENLGS